MRGIGRWRDLMGGRDTGAEHRVRTGCMGQSPAGSWEHQAQRPQGRRDLGQNLPFENAPGSTDGCWKRYS